MISIINDIVNNGKIVVDETGCTTVELLGVSFDLANVTLSDNTPVDEKEVTYYKKLFPAWRDAFVNVDKSASRRFVYTDDKECMSMLHLLWRDNHWQLFVHMRSLDIIGKLPANIVSLQQFCLSEGYTPVRIIIAADSAHIYMRDLLKYYQTNCTRRKAIAVIVQDGKIVTTATNECLGDPEHCIRKELKIPKGEKIEMCMGIHCEVNAIIESMQHGIDLTTCDMYATYSPCAMCANAIIKAGINKFYCLESGGGEVESLGYKLLRENNDIYVSMIK
jgi:dCMP deaminase